MKIKISELKMNYDLVQNVNNRTLEVWMGKKKLGEVSEEEIIRNSGDFEVEVREEQVFSGLMQLVYDSNISTC